MNEPWRKHIYLNEINKASKGGSEMMYEGVVSRIYERDPTLLDGVQIICSRVRDFMPDMKYIYWLHDLPTDPECSHLQHQESRDRFHKIVFCGNWQAQQYRNTLGVPQDSKCTVIETAIEPLPRVKKEDGEIRLIYTSTPQRGLELLVPAFEELCKHHDDVTLDVFSSFAIYGWPGSDIPYKALFDKCREHPKINYHGFAPNEVVREHLLKAHILAYPSIWMECNSRSLIEAMSAGVLCVHPNFAGLPDTAGGMTLMYDMDINHNAHVNKFYGVLEFAVQNVMQPTAQGYLGLVKDYADARYNWNRIIDQWVNMIRQVKAS